MSLTTESHRASTRDGWSLSLRRAFAPERRDPSLRPVLIVPGYGMNGHVFGFHARGTSFTHALAASGRDVWCVDLRRHGASRKTTFRAAPPSLEGFALHDLPTAVGAVLATTGAEKLDLIGVSLGGTMAYAYLATHRAAPVGALVAMGAPLRWDRPHPAVALAFASPGLVGRVPIRGTRALAGLALPVLGRIAPALFAPYVNAERVDLRHAAELVRTVEDPHPRVNEDLARWLKLRHLVIGGVRVAGALRSVRIPLLVVVANRDGIVPASAALSVRDTWGGDDVEVLQVGDETHWYAHADPYVAHDAEARVFTPVVAWLDVRR